MLWWTTQVLKCDQMNMFWCYRCFGVTDVFFFFLCFRAVWSTAAPLSLLWCEVTLYAGLAPPPTWPLTHNANHVHIPRIPLMSCWGVSTAGPNRSDRLAASLLLLPSPPSSPPPSLPSASFLLLPPNSFPWPPSPYSSFLLLHLFQSIVIKRL